MFMNVDLLHGSLLITDIPNLECQVISGEDVVAVFRELDVRDGGDDFGEEGFL